jgi:hypothetical protein
MKRMPGLAANLRGLAMVAALMILASCGGGTAPMILSTVSSVAVSCTLLSVEPGQTTQCTATVMGSGNYSSAVIWTASAGTINSSGLFTAPGTTGNVTVIATSSQAAGLQGSAVLTVTTTSSSITSVAVSCAPTLVQFGQTSQCAAAVAGSGNYNSAITWSASPGTISSSGLFTAPSAAGTATITATSVQNSSKTGTATVTINANNTATVTVGFGGLGPSGQYVNGIFTTVIVCAPASISNCITVPNVLVDSGSIGLRVLESALGSVETALIPVADSGNNPLQECIQFADFSYVWGPVALANVKVAGEIAAQIPGGFGGESSGIPIQIITNPVTIQVPTNCLSSSGSVSSPVVDDNTLELLGANGILGIENYPQDCGPDCTGSSGNVPAQYYICPNGVCESVGVPLSQQLWNPVAAFATDNNGVMITLPPVTASGAASVTGSLIFGIGTQSDNSLGSATTYATDSNLNFQTTYNGVTYTSFLDTGSNALYFSDHNTLSSTGIVECSGGFVGYYCPSSSIPFSVTNIGTNGTKGTVSFSIANAINLFNTGNAVFNNIGGDSGTNLFTDYFDFGVPFFLGRTVFVGLPNSTYLYGYWAY